MNDYKDQSNIDNVENNLNMYFTFNLAYILLKMLFTQMIPFS